MNPDEIERVEPLIRLRIGRVPAVADIEADALDADLSTDVAARTGDATVNSPNALCAFRPR